jgi:plastocyanin
VGPETVFYIVGGALAVLAVVVSFLGLRQRSFPGSRAALAGGIAVFAVFVVATTTAAVISARDEQEHREAELAEHAAETEEAAAGEEAAEAEETGTEGPSGASEAEAQQAQGQVVTLSSPEDGSTTFDPAQLAANPGAVSLEYTNPSPVEHNVALEADGAEEGDLVTDGDISTVSAELQRGQYAYYCSVPGHREAGMEGTLTVR